MKLTRLFLPAISATMIAACGGDDDTLADAAAVTPAAAAGAPAAIAGTTQTIDKTAAAGGFNALLAAVTKADLGAALSDPNARLTVFAPTDAAFARLATSLGYADATAMVNALPAAAIKSILTYHVLPASKPSSELGAAPQSTQATLYAFEGRAGSLALAATSSGVTITDAALATANVTTPDVAASNGVIHAIDKVLIPPGVLNIVQMAQVNPQLSSLVGAVVSTGLQTVLAGPGPFTVFAPTNAAFAQAPTGLNTTQLSTVLTYHALGASVLASQIPFGTPIETLARSPIVINAGTPPTITDTTSVPARIVATDVRANNGVIHVIDKVLIPTL